MARAWHLKSRPSGMPTHDNFELKELSLPPLADGQIRIRNRWLSVDPYMRGRMNDVKSYVPPFQLGEPMEGGAVGECSKARPMASRGAISCSTWAAGATKALYRYGGPTSCRTSAQSRSSSLAFSARRAQPDTSGCST